MAYYVYVLACYKNGSVKCYYPGQTNSIYERVGEHIENVKNGDTDKYTGRFDYVKKIWHKQVPTRADALKLERYLKNLSHDGKRAYMNNH